MVAPLPALDPIKLFQEPNEPHAEHHEPQYDTERGILLNLEVFQEKHSLSVLEQFLDFEPMIVDGDDRPPAPSGVIGEDEPWFAVLVRLVGNKPECTINSKDAIPLSRPSTLFPSPEP